MQEVSGQRDPAMSLLKRLQTMDGRLRENAFIVEDAELVRRALDMGADVRMVIFSGRFLESDEGRLLEQAVASRGIGACSASSGLIAKMIGSKPTPDCIAVVRRKLADFESLVSSPSQAPLIMMAEDCENADNLGMLLRSTEAAGCDGVALSAGCADPFSRRTVRGSRGAVFSVPLCVSANPAGMLAAARKRGFLAIGGSANAKAPYTSPDYTRPAILVVGNEHTGLSAKTRNECDAIVAIPMKGKINSLNIAAAATVLLYEALRQRECGGNNHPI